MRRFQLSEGSSHKFWEIELKGKSFTVRYGRIGTNGAELQKDWPTVEKAKAEADKLIREKTNKGYVEVTQDAAPVATGGTSKEAFILALQTNPDDTAGWSAFTDYLTEQGDSRAEFMRVQLALEDESLTKEERKKLTQEEAKLLKKNLPMYLGEDLHNCFIKEARYPMKSSDFVFRRGWLWCINNLSILDDDDREPHQQAIACLVRSDATLFLQELNCDHVGYDLDISKLAAAKFLRNIKRISIGESEFSTHSNGEGIPGLVAACPKLQYLHLSAHSVDSSKLFRTPMPELLDLSVNCIHDYDIAGLVRNKTLGKLERLSFRPHAFEYGDSAYLTDAHMTQLGQASRLTNLKKLGFHLWDGGDEMADALLTTGLIFRLEELDLEHGNMTDQGLQDLLDVLEDAGPGAIKLKKLNMNSNAIQNADDFEEAFGALGIELTTVDQHDGTPNEYLYNGDIE